MHGKNTELPASINPDDRLLNNFRLQGDPVADELVSNLAEANDLVSLYPFLTPKTWSGISEIAIQNPGISHFLLDNNQLPSWADSVKLNNAASLFRSNGNEFLFMLGIVSLPYCYAAAKGAEALYHTEKIRKNTERRLLDTTSFLIEIMRPGAFEEGGAGFLAVKQVRLRHALARYYLQKIPDIAKLQEMPVNEEDMAGTNLAFSYVALKALPKIGVHFKKETQNDYLHFWAVIGNLMGVDRNLLASDLKQAYRLERTIARRQFCVSDAGRELTNQLLSHYKAQIPNKMTTLLIKPLMRHLLGNEVSSIIGLGNKTVINPADYLMTLLPLFKKYIFPPVQSFEFISEQIELRQRSSESRLG